MADIHDRSFPPYHRNLQSDTPDRSIPCVGFNPPPTPFCCMSSAPTDRDELIQRFIDGELSLSELQDELGGIGADTDRDELWARWSEQGLFDDPISRDSWTSRRNGGYEVVRDDG